jgi:hypothetical protein
VTPYATYAVPRRGVAKAVVLGACAVAIVGHLVNPYTMTLPHCPFHALTGLWCPACGSTRALFSLMHGDIAGAVKHNVLFLPAVSLLFWELASYVTRAYAPNYTASWLRTPLQRRSRALWAIPLVIAVFWVVRNIPGAPERLLSS